MDSGRQFKLVFNSLPVVAHVFLLAVILVFVGPGNLLALGYALISIVAIVAAYYLMVMKSDRKGLYLLIAISILNIPIGIISWLSCYYMNRWLEEEKAPLKSAEELLFGKGIGRIATGEPTIGQHWLLPSIMAFVNAVLVLLGVVVTLAGAINGIGYIILGIFNLALITAGLFMLKTKKFQLSVMLFALAGLLNLPLGLLLWYSAYKIHRQSEALKSLPLDAKQTKTPI